MRRISFVFLCALTLAVVVAVGPNDRAEATDGDVAIVIHGGAGTILKSNMTPEREAKYRGKLTEALETGYKILVDGGSSLDAVEAVIRTMEDSPLFNAGRGAVFTNQGRNEMDASIMDGATLNAGAVASVSGIKNPISAARLVMTESRHVMLVGAGAVTFASDHGLELADSAYFWTKDRWDRLQKAKAKEDSVSSLRLAPAVDDDEKLGTVGCIALDKSGNIAAGTSTGGLTNKRWGRVGDSPIIGAGNYANNNTCGVSGTGVGEYFMRGLIAYEVSAHMEYKGMTLDDAAAAVIQKLTDMGGTGGFIALDADGNVAMPFNTQGMYRGYINAAGEPHVFLYEAETSLY
jgi:beta-aspartyl-peptidase (threonine type)